MHGQVQHYYGLFEGCGSGMPFERDISLSQGEGGCC
jgi:hypothetical protein